MSGEVRTPCRLVYPSVASRSLLGTASASEPHESTQSSSEEGRGPSTITCSLEKWNIDPLTGTKRMGSNWNYETELSALAHRIGIDAAHLPLLQEALRDKNLQDPSSSRREDQAHARDPSHLSDLGRSVTLHYVHEYLYYHYPKLSDSMLKDVRDFLNSDSTLTGVATHLGISHLIQTRRILCDASNVHIVKGALYAVIGVLYERQGGRSARSFVTDFIISQLASGDLSELLRYQHPRFMLQAILKSMGKPSATSRLVRESGRATHFPSFVVGVYSEGELLGEGCGTSLKRAEREAMLTALQSHFEYELSNAVLPSDKEDTIPAKLLLQWTKVDTLTKAESTQANE